MAKLHPRTTQWSDSKYNIYKQCAFRFYHQYIVKTKVEQDNYHLERGIAIHKKGEEFLKGNITGMPKEYKEFSRNLNELKKDRATPEQDISVTYDWKKSFSTDWNNVWLRGKVDAINTKYEDLYVVDFKTGKVYEDKAKQQSEIYAVCLAAYFPNDEYFYFDFWYLDQGAMLNFHYTKKDVDKLRKKYKKLFGNAHARIQDMIDKEHFPTNRSKLCRFCPYRKSNNGPCCYE